MAQRAQQILAATAEAQRRIIEAIARDPSLERDPRFAQVGLRDGLDTVEEYVRVGETVVAFEHLLYMIEETGIPLSSSSAQFVEETARKLGLRVPKIPVAD
jgi:hypothetical protein